MCGRFASTTPTDQLAAYFGAEAPAEPEDGDEVRAGDYNVAPTRDVPVVRVRDEARHLDRLRWGLVPRWAKDLRIGSKMINARSETVATKNAYRSAFAKRRCIVTADGFYEWQRKDDGSKQPMYIRRTDGDPLAFAGLWERWKDAEELREFHTFTILTCSPNATMAPIHDRMPVMLAPGDWERWLDPSNTDIDGLQELLVPAPDDLLLTHPVSTDVNNVRNNHAGLIDEVAVA